MTDTDLKSTVPDKKQKELPNKEDQKQEEIVMYILINNDLGMAKGKIASQAAHVAGLIVHDILTKVYELSTPEALEDYNYYEKWMSGGKYKKIVLKASESDLLKLINSEKKCRYVIDAGLTQIKPNSLTVVGFFPRDYPKDKFKDFKLL